ncbi:MAG: guanylate kinase [Ostreibacterium sp.]
MNNGTKGRLWIVAAPSGGGKTSLVDAAVAEMHGIVRSVSFTTRQKRVGEVNGKDYVFVDKSEFEALIIEKKMLEYEKVFEHYYGTSLAFINEHLKTGKDVILAIDWQGSRQVRKMIPNSRGIFILPPRIEVLAARLRHRGQDDEVTIARRMATAKEQISHYDEFDYLIVNDDFEKALSEIMMIFGADRLCRHRQIINYDECIDHLLK